MAHFSNSSDGSLFDEQCAKCIGGKRPCPIAWIQHEYNYSSYKNKMASDMLMQLVKNDGTCKVWELFKDKLEVDPNQEELF